MNEWNDSGLRTIHCDTLQDTPGKGLITKFAEQNIFLTTTLVQIKCWSKETAIFWNFEEFNHKTI